MYRTTVALCFSSGFSIQAP